MPHIKYALLVLWLTITPLCNALDSQKLAAAGIAAFKQKDFSTALTFFQQAEQAGDRSVKLQFNIAVTSFQLGLLEQAITYFKELDGTSLDAIAHYNIGLCREAQGNTEQAIQAFKAVQNSHNVKLQKMATLAITRLHDNNNEFNSDSTFTPKKSDTSLDGFALLSLSKASDSNITLKQSDTQSHQRDTYTQIYMMGQLDLPLSFAVFGSILDLTYDDDTSFDFNVITLGLEKELSFKSLGLTPSISYEKLNLDSKDYLSSITGEIAVKGKLNNIPTSLSFEYASVTADATTYLANEGKRYQVRFELTPNMWKGKLRMRMEAENNSRKNSASTDHSPSRLTAATRYRYRWSRTLSTDIEANYRHSRYSKIASQARTEKRAKLNASARYTLYKHLGIDIKAFYSKHLSSRENSDYERNGLSVGLLLSL